MEGINKIISLDVNGTIIKSDKNTLKRLDFFKNLFDRWSDDEERAIQINIDPKIYSNLINYLTIPNYVIPEKYYENTVNLMNYYGLDSIYNRRYVISKEFTIRESVTLTFENCVVSDLTMNLHNFNPQIKFEFNENEFMMMHTHNIDTYFEKQFNEKNGVTHLLTLKPIKNTIYSHSSFKLKGFALKLLTNNFKIHINSIQPDTVSKKYQNSIQITHRSIDIITFDEKNNKIENSQHESLSDLKF